MIYTKISRHDSASTRTGENTQQVVLGQQPGQDLPKHEECHQPPNKTKMLQGKQRDNTTSKCFASKSWSRIVAGRCSNSVQILSADTSAAKLCSNRKIIICHYYWMSAISLNIYGCTVRVETDQKLLENLLDKPLASAPSIFQRII